MSQATNYAPESYPQTRIRVRHGCRPGDPVHGAPGLKLRTYIAGSSSAAQPHAAGAQPIGWVDLVPHAAVDLEVKVRSSGIAGAALNGDHLTGLHLVTGPDHDL